MANGAGGPSAWEENEMTLSVDFREETEGCFK